MEGLPAASDDRRTLELLGRIKEGDEQAWAELYKRYHDELLFVVRLNLGKKLRAALQSEDVLQSVALEAFRALPKFEHRGDGSLRSFLRKIVLNKIRDRADTYGAKKRSGAVPLTDTMLGMIPEGDPEPRYYETERFERLESCMARLPEEMREVLVLRRIEGLPSKEVARLMDRSDEAVRKLYSRAIARLSLAMADGEVT